MFLMPGTVVMKGDAGLKGADVAGMDAQGLAGLQIADDEFTGEFEPRRALCAGVLQKEAVDTENPGA